MGARIMPPLAAFLFLAALILAPLNAALAQEDSDDAPAYLALGDSLAFGVGAGNPAADGYVGLTEFALEQDKYAETGLAVLNVSSPGETSTDLVEPDGQLDDALNQIAAREDDDTSGNEVDFISIDIGANDLLALAEQDSPCATASSSQSCVDALSQTLRTLQNNLTFALVELRDAAPDAELYVIGLYNPYSGTGEAIDLIASVGVQQVSGVIAAVAADPTLEARYVSLSELFEGRGNEWIASDGIHPNDNGYRAMSEALLAAIQQRPISLPPDLRATVAPDGTTAPGAGTNGDDGVDAMLLWIGLPLAFAAGAVLSSVYFVARGR